MKTPHLTTKTLFAAVAVSGMLAGTAVRAHAATTTVSGPTQISHGLLADDTDSEKHSCKGQNSCKGKGGCKTGDNGCKGQNSCKGKGGCKTNSAA